MRKKSTLPPPTFPSPSKNDEDRNEKINLAPAYFLATIKKWNKSTINHYHQNGDPELIISEASSKPTAQTKSTSVEFWTSKEGLKMLLVSSEAVGGS